MGSLTTCYPRGLSRAQARWTEFTSRSRALTGHLHPIELKCSLRDTAATKHRGGPDFQGAPGPLRRGWGASERPGDSAAGSQLNLWMTTPCQGQREGSQGRNARENT